jgi:hypothetical protein
MRSYVVRNFLRSIARFCGLGLTRQLVRIPVGGLLLAAAAGHVAEAATLDPLASFGGGDGWRAPAEILAGDAAGTDANNDGFYDFLDDTFGNPNLERGMAYNPTTGNLLLLSRFGDPNVVKGLRVLDGTTGVDKGFVDFTTSVVTGGTFNRNMLAVAEDGAIYMANLTTNATSSPFKIYRWGSEADPEPTLVYSGAPLPGARLGDTFDVIGSGTNTRLVAGYGSNPSVPGNNSFAVFDTADGINFTATHVAVDTTPPDAGDFRLGLTFLDEDTVIGKQGDFARVVDFSGGTGTLVDSFDSDGSTLRPMDFAMIDGRPILAIMEASGAQDAIARARIFIYDLSDTSLPLPSEKSVKPAPCRRDKFSNPTSTGPARCVSDRSMAARRLSTA